LVNGLLVTRASADMWQELGRDPTLKELAARTDLPVDEVLEAFDAARAYTASALDAPVVDEGEAPIDTLGGPDPGFELLEDWASVAPAIEELPERERRILSLRFVHDRTQSEIAEEVGISQMHVSRLLARTLERLRDHLT
jgi:RNA polymerase sigma-B factor